MKNKILLLGFVFILFSFALIGSVFAYEESFTYNNNEYTFFIPDTNYNKIITMEEYTSGLYDCFVTIENSRVHVYFIDKNYDFKLRIETNTIGASWCYHRSNIANFPNGVIEYRMTENKTDLTLVSLNSTTLSSNCFSTNRKIYMWTNLNVYTDENYTNFFFKAPVTEQPEIPETEEELTLAGIMKTAGEQATMEMGQIILIVIATTAGLIVLLIGLKKGLKVLMNGFRH